MFLYLVISYKSTACTSISTTIWHPNNNHYGIKLSIHTYCNTLKIKPIFTKFIRDLFAEKGCDETSVNAIPFGHVERKADGAVFTFRSNSFSITQFLAPLPPTKPAARLRGPLPSSIFYPPRCEDGGVLEGSPLLFCDGSRWNGSAPHCMRESQTIFSWDLLIVLWPHSLMKSAVFLI